MRLIIPDKIKIRAYFGDPIESKIEEYLRECFSD